jgi:hypothetical protein
MTFDRVACFMQRAGSTSALLDCLNINLRNMNDHWCRAQQPRGRFSMAHTKVEKRIVKTCLTEEEFAVASWICDRYIPADWFVDPKVDHSRVDAPRVWICLTVATNAAMLSFGFGTQSDTLYYVVIQSNFGSESHLTMGIALFADLTVCQMILLLSSDYAQDNRTAPQRQGPVIIQLLLCIEL